MSTLQTRVRQWALVDGVRHMHSDALVARIGTAQPATSHKGQLFVAVEAADHPERGRAACALVADTIRDIFYADRAAHPATSLQRAVRAAHDALCTYNRRTAPSQPTLVGATCVAMHNNVLYVAQVLPAQAFVRHDTHVQAFPARANDALDAAEHALGSPRFTAPHVQHLPLAPNDAVVLCSSNVVAAAAWDDAHTLIAGHDARGVAQRLYDQLVATHPDQAHTLVVEWIAGASDDDHALASDRVRHTTTDSPAARPPQVLAREQALPPTTIAPRTRQQPSARTHATPHDGTPRARSAPARAATEHARQAQDEHAAQPTRQRTVRRGALPRSRSARPVRAVQRRMPVRSIAAACAAVILVLAGFGVQQLRHGGTRTALAALAAMEQSVAAAEGAGTHAAAQNDLLAAERTLRTQIEPLLSTGVITESNLAAWQAYQQVQRRYEHALATISRVSFADQLQPVAGLPAGSGLINRIVLGTPTQHGAAPAVFVLDRSQNRVLQAGHATPVLHAGQDIAGKPVARLRDVLWGGDTPLFLERGAPSMPGYRVLRRDGDQWLTATLARTETMTPIDGDLPVASWVGNVYVWDRTTKQVWQYAADDLAAAPTPVLGDVSGVALDNVVDIAVDGRIYLLNSDGSMVVIENGVAVQQFPAPALAPSLATVTRMVVTPAWQAADGTSYPGAIYVLDTQNERVLQINKTTGELITQIRTRQHGVLNQLTDLAVDEAGGRLYMANGAQVFETPLRSLPAGTTTPAEQVK